MSETTWRDDAICLGMDPELFVPEGKGRPAVEGVRVCMRCPVRRECAIEAVGNDPLGDHGIWGGTTDHHRSKVRSGRWTVEQAMAAGDRIADAMTVEERLARDEPWLTDAVPVVVRPYQRPEAWKEAS